MKSFDRSKKRLQTPKPQALAAFTHAQGPGTKRRPQDGPAAALRAVAPHDELPQDPALRRGCRHHNGFVVHQVQQQVEPQSGEHRQLVSKPAVLQAFKALMLLLTTVT